MAGALYKNCDGIIHMASDVAMKIDHDQTQAIYGDHVQYCNRYPYRMIPTEIPLPSPLPWPQGITGAKPKAIAIAFALTI